MKYPNRPVFGAGPVRGLNEFAVVVDGGDDLSRLHELRTVRAVGGRWQTVVVGCPSDAGTECFQNGSVVAAGGCGRAGVRLIACVPGGNGCRRKESRQVGVEKQGIRLRSVSFRRAENDGTVPESRAGPAPGGAGKGQNEIRESAVSGGRRQNGLRQTYRRGITGRGRAVLREARKRLSEHRCRGPLSAPRQPGRGFPCLRP